MTFYEKLEKHLSKKQYVLVTRGDGYYYVFSHITDYNGNYRESRWHETKEKAIQHIGCCPGYNPASITRYAEEKGWKILKAFDIPQKRFKKGDIVLVDENAKELCKEAGISWNDKKEAMLSKRCEIMDICVGYYLVYTSDKLDYCMLPHSALSYPVDEEDNQ